jgi:diguanylate cyclase (GGDEF)-like protein
MKPKILLADDDNVLNHMLRAALEKWGWQVTLCQTGEAAWQQLTQPDGPHLAILDWMLPDMEGIELCRRIRDQQNSPYVYVILLTSKSSHGDLLQGMEAGADEYLTKPCDLDELHARVRAGQRILDLQSKLLSVQEELQRQATHDALTGIWNRRAILEHLDQEMDRALREGSSLGVIMADIDHFKSINDTYGHPAGDKVLHDAAQSIHGCLRSYDAVGRYGGEEFLVVLPKCTLATATEIAERIRRQLAGQPIEISAASISVTFSLGVAAHAVDTPSSIAGAGTIKVKGQALIVAADEALYAAKQQGRNRVVAAPQVL